MMSPLHRVFAAAAILLLGGCVPSIHGIYTDKDLVEDPLLAGSWREKDKQDGEHWTFRKGEGKQYELQQRDRDKVSRFEARLVRLDGRLYMDLYPGELNSTDTELYKGHAVPAHTFYKASLEKGTLKLFAMDTKWLDKLLQGSPSTLAHVRPRLHRENEDMLLLTAPTAQLQAFLKKHAETKDAWDDDGVILTRENP